MSRRVFFSFHYGRDLWRANVVRNSGMVDGVSAAGFIDASLWEATKRQGDVAIRTMIDRGLEGTTATVVLVGADTARRRWIDYEIRESLARGNGLLGIRVNAIKDQAGQLGEPGDLPTALAQAQVPIYSWEYGRLGAWVEEAVAAAAMRRRG